MASYLFEKSLRIIQITSILRSFWLAYFLSVIYQKFVGLNDFTIGISLLLMGVSIFVLDIPTGVFADKFGYKKKALLFRIFLSRLLSSRSLQQPLSVGG